MTKTIATIALGAAALAFTAQPAGADVDAVEPTPEKIQAWAVRQHVVDKIAELDAIYNTEITDFNAGLDTEDTAKRGSKKVDKIRGSLTHSPDKRLNKLTNAALDEVGDLFEADFFDVEPTDPEAVEDMHRVAAKWENVKARLVVYGVVGPDTQWSLLTASALPAAPAAPQAPPPTNPPTMSLDEFNQIATGMSYDQVVQIVGGPGTQLAHTEIAGYVGDVYMWDGEGGLGANSNVQFQNGRMIGKAQFGLR
jgi:hypothetical protein